MSRMKFLAVFSFLVAVSSALAQETPTTPVPTTPVTVVPSSSVTIDGTANQAVLRNWGDTNVGGFGSGNSVGAYTALSDCDVFGVANANGVATGVGAFDATTASAASRGFVSSDVTTNGRNVTINVSGFSEQGNWASVGNPDANFATGGSYTSGKHNGAFSGINLLDGAKGSGSSESTGSTNVLVSQAPDGMSNHAESTTQGSSLSQLNTVTGTTSVNGNGGIGLRSILGDPTQAIFAGAKATGNATFAGNGINTISGSLNVAGVTNTLVTPTSVSANSTVNSQATIVCGGLCGPVASKP